MIDINTLVRGNIKKLEPYSSSRDEFTGTKDDMIFLDANENPFKNGLNRYPDPRQLVLRQKLSRIKLIDEDCILLGNGSDEVIDLIFRAFCEPNADNVIILPPTYGMYKVSAVINAIETNMVMLMDDFQPDVDAILKCENPSTKILFLCSPNNPSGNSIAIEKVEKLINEFKGLVVIDEAYIDFSDQSSWLTRLGEFPNLIVTQTFSKAYGMAGIRLGVCCASKDIISILNKIKPPYNINELTQEKAINCLENLEKVEMQIIDLKENRSELQKQLKDAAIIKTIFPTDANFVLVQVDDANKRYKELIQMGIVVRNRSNEPLCGNCLRLTIGTKEENKKLIHALKSLDE